MRGRDLAQHFLINTKHGATLATRSSRPISSWSRSRPTASC